MKKIMVLWLCAILMASVFGAIIPPNTSAYTTHDPIYIDGNAGFTSENGTTGGTGTQSDPYIIEGWDISAFLANGIEIQNTDAYFIIRNCYVYDGGSFYNGIHFDSVQNGQVENTISLNNNYGIYLYRYSSNNNLYNNTANLNNYHGICLDFWCDNNNIFNNTANLNNYHGICVVHSSDNNNISNNTANSNNRNGIRLCGDSSNNNVFNNNVSNNWYGIYLDCSSYNNISNNTANSNNYHGIYLEASIYESSSYNTFVSNNISCNSCSVEIYDSNCENNTFHHNNFISGNVVNVTDNGVDTKWDDGYGEGNYWSNYTGLDDGSNARVAGDGVGDTNIPHMGLDNYPLMEPVEQPYTPETTPPVISSVNVSEITETSAIITWTTDEYSDSRVNYSINADLSLSSIKYDSTMITTHSITLTDLNPGTTYYFEVSSTDGSGNSATDTNNSNYYRFTTLDTTPPVISLVGVSNITENSAKITWITDENSDSRINYSVNADLSSNFTKYDWIMTTSHSITLTGLSPGTTYYFEVSSTDGFGNTAIDNNNSNYYKFTILEDTVPPVISLVSVSDITDNSGTITWITYEPSDSRVNYSINADLSSNSTQYNSMMTTSHSITLTDLNPETTYYFEVISTDSYGNTATDDNNSHYYTFTTEKPTTGGPEFSIIDYWWVILLVVIVIVIVVIVTMSRRKKGKF